MEYERQAKIETKEKKEKTPAEFARKLDELEFKLNPIAVDPRLRKT